VTDGTSGGTSELTVTGAYSGGLLYSGDPDFTVFGSKVLFAGFDASNHDNLWVTDGTAAGTSELTGASPAATAPSDWSVLGSKAVFEGNDASGRVTTQRYLIRTLWVTDGTLAGTSQLTVAGASVPLSNSGYPKSGS